jgi:hypothetical protein
LSSPAPGWGIAAIAVGSLFDVGVELSTVYRAGRVIADTATLEPFVVAPSRPAHPVRDLWDHCGDLAKMRTFNSLYRLEIRPALVG